jgi:hypothetical protein
VPRVHPICSKLGEDAIPHAVFANLRDDGRGQAQPRSSSQRIAAVAAALRPGSGGVWEG